MITTKLIGGLGNQMFQYAIARHLAIKNGDALTLDLSELLKRDGINYTPRNFELDVFDIKYVAKTLSGDSGSFKDRLTLKYLRKKVNENGHNFDAKMLDLKGNIHLNGWWQNEKYFKGIENIIRKDFTLKPKAFTGSEILKKKIISTNSVSVHFRFGDYLSNPTARAFHGILPSDYYKNSIKKMTELVPSPHFFIFSDDVDWVKTNFLFEQDHTFVTPGNQNGAFDMHLMSLCKHNVIANSSFSWWGAWLNQNPGKIVIGPTKWFNDTPTEILPSRWIKI
jgi:hypothetical protein